MATRLENRLGVVSALGSTYTLLATITQSTNSLFNICNKAASPSKLRLYIADASWSTGEPTGGTLVVELAYDVEISVGDLIQISGNLFKAGEKIVVWASVASSLSISLNSVEIT